MLLADNRKVYMLRFIVGVNELEYLEVDICLCLDFLQQPNIIVLLCSICNVMMTDFYLTIIVHISPFGWEGCLCAV